MRKRDLIRHTPGLSKVALALDNYERHNAHLTAANRHLTDLSQEFERHNTQLTVANHQLTAEVQQLRQEFERHNAQLTTANQRLTAELQRLRNALSQMIFAGETSLVEDEAPGPIAGAGGLPVPAAVLRFLVAGTDDLEWFLHAGKLGAQTLVDLLARQCQTLDQFQRILDFGCGCGRVLRHLKGLTGAEIHGTDSNPRAVQWCEKYLRFAQVRVNALEPPLPYPDRTFDLIYAFSVFTHLTEPLQARWMEEMRRVLIPGGTLILTVHGDKCAECLPPAHRAEYDKGTLVVVEPDVVGTNYCGAFQPESQVRGVLARGFEVVDFIPEGAKGNAPQDAYVMRSRT